MGIYFGIKKTESEKRGGLLTKGLIGEYFGSLGSCDILYECGAVTKYKMKGIVMINYLSTWM